MAPCALKPVPSAPLSRPTCPANTAWRTTFSPILVWRSATCQRPNTMKPRANGSNSRTSPRACSNISTCGIRRPCGSSWRTSSWAYKPLEPAQEPSIDDEDGLNDLYYVHDRKLTLLNQAVHALIKVQDIINRLLHECLGGDRVDTTDPEWESYELRRKNIIKGLDAKRAAGSLSQSDYDAITGALKIPRNTPKGEITRTYRNRLAHQVRPSVDYSMFFANLESRVGQEIKDAQGNVIGRRFPLLSKPPAEYQFKDLDEAFS